MAHIKCKYQKFECSMSFMYGKEGEKCNRGIVCEDCDNLYSSDCFLEITSKKVDYDGASLIVGKDFFAFADWDYTYPGRNYIDSLEIDGEQYIPDTPKEEAAQ